VLGQEKKNSEKDFQNYWSWAQGLKHVILVNPEAEIGEDHCSRLAWQKVHEILSQK
jgi:hypothetical protein